MVIKEKENIDYKQKANPFEELITSEHK